mgnify:CR=1 FL=1
MIAGKRLHDGVSALTVGGAATGFWLLAGRPGSLLAVAAHLALGAALVLASAWQLGRGWRRLLPGAGRSGLRAANAWLSRVLLADVLALCVTGVVLWLAPDDDPLGVRMWRSAHYAAHEVLLPTLAAHVVVGWARRRALRTH